MFDEIKVSEFREGVGGVSPVGSVRSLLPAAEVSTGDPLSLFSPEKGFPQRGAGAEPPAGVKPFNRRIFCIFRQIKIDCTVNS